MFKKLRALFLCAVSVVVFGQSHKPTTAPIKKRITEKSQPGVPFEPGWTSIPKAFRADDPETMAKALDIRKTDFESKAEYQAKLLAIAVPEKIYVFFAEPVFGFGEGEMNVKYDAESQRFHVVLQSLPRVGLFDGSGANFDLFWLLKREKDGEPFIGTNAFGVKKKITRKDLTYIRVGSRGRWNLKRGRPGDMTKWTLVDEKFEVNGKEAPAWKDDLRHLFVVKLTPASGFSESFTYLNDFLFEDIKSHEPTIQRPYEFRSLFYDLSVDIQEVWIYRKSSGEVLKKITAPPADTAS